MTPLFARLFDALDNRIRLHDPLRKLANKLFPTHWSFLLGEVALVCLVVLVATGIFLTMHYRPSAQTVVYQGSSPLYEGRELPAAFESIIRLTHDVPGGLFFRRVHRAASHLFIATIILHLLRVLLTGAFRRPRGVNYGVGVTLLLVAVVSGYTGHNLPFDVLAGTSLRIAYTLVGSIPFVGSSVVLWLFGGQFPTGDLLPRMYTLHILLAPGALVGGVTLHMLILGRQTHTQRPQAEAPADTAVVGEPLWPLQAAKTTTLALTTGAVLAASAVLVPWSDVDLHGPYIVAHATNASQPDWFLFWVEGALRLYPPVEWHLLGTTVSGPFLMGAAVPLLCVAALYAYPLVERRLRPYDGDQHAIQRPTDVPLRLGLVSAGVVFMTVLTLAAGNDVAARLLRLPTETVIWGLRLAVLVLPPLVGVLAARGATRRAAGVGGGR